MGNLKLRKGPYGPPMSPIGIGAILQAAAITVVEPGANQALSDTTVELSSDIAGGATDYRPLLSNVRRLSRIRVSVEMQIFVAGDTDGLTNADLNLELEVTRAPGNWQAIGGIMPTFPENVSAAGEPSSFNDMRHTVRFQAEIPSVGIGDEDTEGSTITARCMLSSSLTEGLFVEMLEGQVTIRIEELVGGGQVNDDLRRPSAGHYRAARAEGAILQQWTDYRSPAAADQVITAVETEISGVDPGDMRPNLTPLRSDSVMRVIAQIIVETDADWVSTGEVAVSLQLSDDDGATWVEVGDMSPIIERSLSAVGPDVANSLRTLLPYQAEAPILAAFPAYVPGTEILARATVLTAALADAAAVTNDGGGSSATYLTLQEVRA